MKEFKINEKFRNSLVQYLANKPFGEVNEFIQYLTTLQPVPPMQTIVPPKAPEVVKENKEAK